MTASCASPPPPTREGYTFWHADQPEQSEPVQSDVNIYAQWTKNADQNEIDVLYAANGGQFATGETFQQGVTDSDGMMRQPQSPPARATPSPAGTGPTSPATPTSRRS